MSTVTFPSLFLQAERDSTPAFNPYAQPPVSPPRTTWSEEARRQVDYRNSVARHHANSEQRKLQWSKRLSRAQRDGQLRGLFGLESGTRLKPSQRVVTTSSRRSGLDSTPGAWDRELLVQQHWKPRPLDALHERSMVVIDAARRRRQGEVSGPSLHMIGGMTNSVLFGMGLTVDAVKLANTQKHEHETWGNHERSSQLHQANEALEQLREAAYERQEAKAHMEEEEESLQEAISGLQLDMEREEREQEQADKKVKMSPTRSTQDVMEMIAEAERLAQETVSKVVP